jgi:hypothetical protein
VEVAQEGICMHLQVSMYMCVQASLHVGGCMHFCAWEYLCAHGPVRIFQQSATENDPHILTHKLGPPVSPTKLPVLMTEKVCLAHLLLQLVLIALPGQLVLVLGPLGRKTALRTLPCLGSH